jgi:hypothetical protein
MAYDFTLTKYDQFCSALKRLKCSILTVNEYIQANKPDASVIVLRHDIDRCLSSALRMAALEARHGIRSSYYVRMTRAVFKPAEIKKLHKLGHDLGYHYEVLAKTRGDHTKAIALFETELEKLRAIVPVNTISMHGSPLKPWNNLDLWQQYDAANYRLNGDISLNIDYSNIFYFTDTGRSWDAGRYNLRDRVNSKRPTTRIHSTDQLIDFLSRDANAPVFVNTHPNRWANSFFDYLTSLLSDWSANRVKALLFTLRQSREES